MSVERQSAKIDNMFVRTAYVRISRTLGCCGMTAHRRDDSTCFLLRTPSSSSPSEMRIRKRTVLEIQCSTYHRTLDVIFDEDGVEQCSKATNILFILPSGVILLMRGSTSSLELVV